MLPPLRLSLLMLATLAACAGSKGSADAPAPRTPPPRQAPQEASVPTSSPTPETELYLRTYGEGDATLVFLHGGPGYNAALFEASTAEVLGEQYEVIVYDRRGSGRSASAEVEVKDHTFENAAADLDAVLAGIEAPILIGHSFGGILALEYLARRPDFRGAAILVNAPIEFPRTLKTIIANCRTVYESRGDTTNLEYLTTLEAMDPSELQYANFAFVHGMSCGLYRPGKTTPQAQAIMAKAAEHPAAGYFTNSQFAPVTGFYAHERYTALDETENLRKHAAGVWAIYGAEDRIISPEDRALLGEVLGNRYQEIPGAAHNTFVDQQEAFRKAVDQAVAQITAAKR